MGNRKSKSSKKKSNPRENNTTEEADTSDDSSDMESDVEMGSDSDDKKKKDDNGEPKPSTSHQADDLSDSSSSGDETCEKCAICLRLIKSQEVGSPEGCDHLFCAVCIIEWSKTSNVCPLDRQPFTIILVRKNINGNVVRQVTVEEPRPIEILELEDDTFCEICGGSDREDRILLCDGCDRGFHTECLTPPLSEIPLEDEWFCPDCSDTTTPLAEEVHMYASELDDLLEDAEITPVRLRNLRPRNVTGRVISRVRTRLFERIRQAVVSQMVRNNRMRDIIDDIEDEESRDDGFLSFGSSSEESSSNFSSDSESESVTSESQPGPSGLQTKAKPKTKPKTTKKKTTRKRKTTKKGKTTKKKTTRKRKTKKTGTKRKTTKRRKTSTRTSIKKIKIENEDGTITEKIVQTKRTVRRRKPTKRRKRKTRKTTKVTKSSRFAKPKTVKGRLALTLGMVPPKKPGQLLPDVKIKPREQPLSKIDLNRARAGIPTLHIFEPRDELQYYSSGSDHEEYGGSGSGGVATATQPRITPSTRIIDRKKAAVILQSSKAPKRKPVVVESTTDSVDILGSILESQTIWHSKDTDVKINFDGSIEYIKDKERIDVRDGSSEEKSTKTPMYPGSGNNSNPGNFGSFNNRNYGGARGGQDNNFSSGGGNNSNFNRFGAPRNDREGYANYLNNMPQGPAPFCRGGPPLRFRMPPRPQLRRGAFPPRLNRPTWQNDEEEGENEEQENKNEEKNEEEDVDLYSDIEAPVEKEEGNANAEEGSGNYPTLGPPPEPPAFLLGIDENGDVPQDKDKSDVYDPAEPCDSEDEMVIDENEKKEEEKEVEKEKEEKEEKEESDKAPIVSNYSSPSRSPEKSPAKRASTEDDDEDCPIFSIYSSASREFSQKEEEEREREIAEEKRKIEEMKLKDEGVKEDTGARLSFEFEDKNENEKSQSDKSPSLSPERDEIEDQKSPSRTPEKKDENDEKVETPKIATGLEGLDVEEVSSENDEGDDFADKRSLSSLSLSELSNRSRSKSPVMMKKKKKKKRKTGKNKKNYEEGEIDDSDKRDIDGKNENEEVGNENSPKSAEKRKRRKSADSDRQVLGSKENKKQTKDKSKDKDLSWKKPSKKDKNYREGKRRSKERRSRSRSRRRSSKSPDNKKDKKKNKDRKKKNDKKKEIERYDVRKIVKNKEVRKTDAFGRDIISKSRSVSRSRSRSPIRDRTRNMLRRDSRSFSRSRSRSFRRGRSPVRRRYLRSRSRSRSKSVRRSFSRSRSRSPRKTKKKIKKTNRSRSRRKSRSISRNRRRSVSRSRSRSPMRVVRNKKLRARRSYSHHISRSPSFSPRRTRSISRSPIRVRRTYSRSVSSSWSRGRSPLPRAASLEKLTVVLTTKDKKKGKKKKDGKKGEEKRRKKSGNSKEVFASGDNVLVSVNFRNNTNTNSNSVNNDNSRRLESLSPVPKKKKEEKKKKSTVSKNVVDAAICPKRAKKLTRLSEKDAEVILNRKPVAVIDLDMSPYREQTPSPINVVVVSDSGSGDEGKEQSPQRQNRQSPGSEIEKSQENIPNQDNISAPSSPVTNGYLQSGPKTPPEPQIKFSISKPQQLRQIANPLGDDDDEEEVEDEEENERLESLDRRIEKELEASHKGPNTPPEPRGPSTPPSSQTSPDAYDPFEPTKSRSPSPSQDKENRPSPKPDSKDEQPSNNTTDNANTQVVEETDKPEIIENEDKNQEQEDVIPVVDSSTNVIPVQTPAEIPESPERKITVVITTPQNNKQTNIQKPYTPILKTIPMVPTTTSTNLTTPPVFSLPSPTKTSKANTTTTQSLQVMGIQRLQHRLGSPVNRTPNSIKSTPEKRSTPRNESFSKRNGEQKQPRPLQDATNETIDMTIDMDDSPYSPASSEGDDLFDPPVESAKPPPVSKPMPVYKPTPGKTQQHKSPIKQLSKFDLLFGPSGPQVSPVKQQSKKAKTSGKNLAATKIPSAKAPKKKDSSKRAGVPLKMDEDQLRILDELPSSAVELQVKDKFLKKLNRQERVVDEVKTVLKPHYARKHITKEEYKDILRRAVPKICHSRSGEINPSKIQSLIEAYVRKFRHAKKKGTNSAAPKPKTKKTMFS